MAKLNATWLTLTEPDFQCKQIEEVYKKRKDADVVIKYRRIERGCGKLHDDPKVEINGIEYHSCLCHDNFKYEDIDNLIWLHSKYKEGTLAYSGGLLDQPALYIECMKQIEHLQYEHEEKIREKDGN